MKLSRYAREKEIGYRAAWNRYKQGKIPGAYQDEWGAIHVPDPKTEISGQAAIYARVSSNKQKEDLDRQVIRMQEFAIARGLSVVKVVTEVASGVNDNRPKLTKLLEDDSWDTLVVEHKDRLSRVGFNWFEVLLNQQGKDIVVANRASDNDHDLMEDFLSIMYSYAARLYGQRGSRKNVDAALSTMNS